MGDCEASSSIGGGAVGASSRCVVVAAAGIVGASVSRDCGGGDGDGDGDGDGVVGFEAAVVGEWRSSSCCSTCSYCSIAVCGVRGNLPGE